MEGKKISFGFSKINKKPNLFPKKENETVTKVDLIKYLEGQEIKLVEEKPEEHPLIIPLKESCKTSAALASLMKRRAVLLGEEESEVNIVQSVKSSTSTNNEDSEDIEKRAARELLADIEKNNSADPTNSLVLPAVKPDDLPLEGAKESTLYDYESVPVQDFGKAMLRGMGWVEPVAETKKGGPPVDDTPMVRPMGMGLGADKALKKQTLLVAPEANEVLEIKRNAHVIILGGKHKDLYGKIEGFDDHAGRVIVEMAIGGAIETFNEFLCQPVSRKEYVQYGKCINTRKYEEYKTKTNECGQVKLNKDEKSLIDKSKKIKIERLNFIEGEYAKDNGDMGKNLEKVDCIESKKDVKKETGLYREEQKGSSRDKKREYDKYDDKKCNKYEDRKSIKEASRNDSKDRGNEDYGDDVKRDYDRKYHHRDRKEYHRDDDRYRQREHDKYESKSNDTHSQMLKRNDHDEYKKSNAKQCEKSSNSKKNSERERKKESYDETSDKPQHKKVELHDLSNPENSSYLSKHKKSKKSKVKKSKKSKKRYRSNSLDIETSSSSLDSSSDSEDEKYKKHKKKTKKSKRQRERSRSRGRR